MARRHILLVDDDPAFLAAVAAALRRAGYQVTESRHFTTALAVLEDAENVPDMLVTDIVMPSSINGIALGRMTKMRYHDLPVVYLTGYDVPGGEQMASGPVLRKPIDPWRLIEVMEEEFAKAERA